MVRLLSPATSWSIQLEWPKEVGGILEIFTNGEDFMNKVFYANDVLLTQDLLDHSVGGDGGTPVVDFHKTSLVDQLSDTLLVGVTPCNVRFADTEHVQGSLVKFDKNSIVDLSKSEQLKGFTDLGMYLVDTTDPNHERQLGLSWDIVVTLGPGLTSETNFIPFLAPVLLDVLFSTLEDLDTSVPGSSSLLNGLLQLQLLGNLVLLPPLQNGFRNCRQFLAGSLRCLCGRCLIAISRHISTIN